ncbi:MAG: hypothetical protein N3A57_07065, partial [Negativicutes bacterium]|nr:hypothetical protein [Negativicutes bacterium]
MTKIKSVNVYDEINQFFDSSEMVTTIISRDMVEGYCRHSAWQGTKDAILRELWRDLRPLVDYLNSHRQLMAERLSAVKSLEYILVFEWMKGRIPGYNADFQQIARILGVWRDFFFYLSEKKQIDSLDEFAEAVELIAQIAQTGQQPKQGQPLFDRMLNKWISARSKQSAQALAENGGDFEGALAERVEQMLNEIVEFFSQPAYRNDMHRALWLFGGPLGEQHELDDMDFWGTFWDWFVFEYHLLDDDLTPLSHYQRSAPKKWSEFEEQIFRELTGLHYRVFYVESIKNGTWVVACDLLTDERFLLPYPDMEIRDIKRMLFYGRMSSRENALLNYLASIPVSTVLRKRIREELTKLKKLYSFQYPQV